MHRDNIDEDILRKALIKFQEETGLFAAEAEQDHNFKTEYQVDTAIKIADQEHHQEVYCYAEIKKNLTRATLGIIAYQFKDINPRLLITNYVTPNLAIDLKKIGIQFIDTCGNAYIDTFPFFIYIRGNRKINERKGHTLGQRAFRGRPGLRAVFALLCNPGLENKTFREIAKNAFVALGTVDATIKNLKEIGLLIEKGKRGRELVHKEKLLERWVTGYQETVRDRCIKGRYTAMNKDWWKDATLPDFFYWGGEVAAAKMTKYLNPEKITVYTRKGGHGELLAKYKLRKDPNGEIEILDIFWRGDPDRIYPDTVHPIVVYADLLATNDDRNLEVAKIIYENEIDRLIRQN